jgi:PAS domain S-box-containing protein
MKIGENNKQDLMRQIEDLQQQVTDLKTALSESEDTFRRLTDSAPVGIYFNDAQGKAVYINNKCAELVGVPTDNALNFDWIPFLHPEDRDRVVSEWKNAFKNSTKFHSEYRWVHQDGKIVWTQGDVIPILGADGKATMFIGTLTDITERKQAEQGLVESQMLLEETGRIGKVGGWEVNIDTGQQTWTEEVYHIHEVELDFNPSVHTGIDFYSEASKPIISKAFQRAVEYGESYDLKLDIITAKGNLRHVHAIGMANLENRRVYGFFQDITAQKKAEIERESLIAQLQDRTTEQERFIYTVSHDLKTPLVNISGFADLAELDFNSGDQVSANKDLDIIKQSALRMRRLLDELLEISRIGIKKNQEKVVNLNTLIEEGIFNLSGLIKEFHTTIEVESDLPDVRLDKQRFIQVIENLISNACRYSRSANNGSIVKIGVVRNAEELICYVKDNGVGLEADYLEKVFGLFEKLDSNSDSTGVGLAIVKRIIENHGGRIWAESEGLGHGSTFFFTVREAKQ